MKVFQTAQGRYRGFTHKRCSVPHATKRGRRSLVVFRIEDTKLMALTSEADLDYLVQAGFVQLRHIMSTSRYSVSDCSHEVVCDPAGWRALELHKELQQELELLKAQTKAHEEQRRLLEWKTFNLQEKLKKASTLAAVEQARSEKELTADFCLNDIPIFLIPKSGHVSQLERKETLAEKASRQHRARATFEPHDAIKGIMCYRTKRVAWHMPNGLIVVDDYGPSLAIHIVDCPELARRMVDMDIAISEARQQTSHLKRIPHGDNCTEEVRSFLNNKGEKLC
jgi:hypothetical protein